MSPSPAMRRALRVVFTTFVVACVPLSSGAPRLATAVSAFELDAHGECLVQEPAACSTDKVEILGIIKHRITVDKERLTELSSGCRDRGCPDTDTFLMEETWNITGSPVDPKSGGSADNGVLYSANYLLETQWNASLSSDVTGWTGCGGSNEWVKDSNSHGTGRGAATSTVFLHLLVNRAFPEETSYTIGIGEGHAYDVSWKDTIYSCGSPPYSKERIEKVAEGGLLLNQLPVSSDPEPRVVEFSQTTPLLDGRYGPIFDVWEWHLSLDWPGKPSTGQGVG